MKKAIKFFAIVLIAVLVAASGAKITVLAKGGSVKSVTITKPTKKSTMTITRKNANVTKQLEVNVKTTGNASKEVTYKSSNKKVASVSSTGLITAKKAGTAKITVTSKRNKKKKDTLKIVVKQKVTGLTASVKMPLASYKNVVALIKGKTYTISPKFKPLTASNKKAGYKSSNPEVAKVNVNGKISARQPGTAKITVKAKDGSGKSAAFTVYVTEKIATAADSITANADKNTLKIGEVTRITTTVQPENATCKQAVYSSSNEKAAVVNAITGEVTAVDYGTATITVRALDGSKKSAKVKITVKDSVTKVTFNKDAEVTATVKFTDKTALASDVTTLLGQSGMKDGSTKKVIINDKIFTAVCRDKKITFNGKEISDITKDMDTIEVTVDAKASEFVAGLQTTSFKASVYEERFTAGKLTFTELKNGTPKSTVKLGGKTYTFTVKENSVYFDDDVKADLQGLAEVADIVVE